MWDVDVDLGPSLWNSLSGSLDLILELEIRLGARHWPWTLALCLALNIGPVAWTWTSILDIGSVTLVLDLDFKLRYVFKTCT